MTPYEIFFYLKLYFKFYGQFYFFENEQKTNKKNILTANNNFNKFFLGFGGTTNEKKIKVQKCQGGAAKIAEMSGGYTVVERQHV